MGCTICRRLKTTMAVHLREGHRGLGGQIAVCDKCIEGRSYIECHIFWPGRCPCKPFVEMDVLDQKRNCWMRLRLPKRWNSTPTENLLVHLIKRPGRTPQGNRYHHTPPVAFSGTVRDYDGQTYEIKNGTVFSVS